MNIHLRIILRKRLKEIHLGRNVLEYLDPGLYHGGDLLKIQGLCDGGL